jgi:hypothetical protein
VSSTSTVLRQLFSAYPHVQATPETIAVYMRLLKDIAPDDLQTIVDQAIATCKFLPTVAELRDMHHGLQRTALPSWVDGWDSVQSEIRRIGSYGVPHFDDPLTAKVVHSMGWRTLCLSETASIDRAQFRDMYTALVSRQDYDQKLLPQARELAARNSGLMIPLRDLLEVAKRKDGKEN